MQTEMRNNIANARLEHYYGIMRTTMFSFAGLAAIIEFGSGNFSLLLLVLVISISTYGILAGNSALEDVEYLIKDVDADFERTHYGASLKKKPIKLFKLASSGLIGLLGVSAALATLT